jgi:hypothetical protein
VFSRRLKQKPLKRLAGTMTVRRDWATIFCTSTLLDSGRSSLIRTGFHYWRALIPPHEIRRSLFRRFPYGIVYQMLKTEAVVLAVMHLSRRPDYWTSRVSQN